MKTLFDEVSHKCSKHVTNTYSSSFSLAINFLHKDFIKPIHSIYGFVRFADEIVDSFHKYDKKELLERFKTDTHLAVADKISLNPILNSFQETVHEYNIETELVDTFLRSMEMDLSRTSYDQKWYEEYILGSAEVVGLMCLKVFSDNDREMYDSLKFYARKLGSAFQKINFLRDMKSDYCELGRLYFPNIAMNEFSEDCKKQIEADIENDFAIGYEGISKLPKRSRFGVYIAYIYYYSLFKKIINTPSAELLTRRIGISTQRKYALLFGSYLRHSLNII